MIMKYRLFSFFLFITLACRQEKATTIVLNDGKTMVTRIDIDDSGALKIVLYPGKFKGELPNSFVYAEYKRLLDGYEAILLNKEDSIFLFQESGDFKYFGIDSNLIFIKDVEADSFLRIFNCSKKMGYKLISNYGSSD